MGEGDIGGGGGRCCGISGGDGGGGGGGGGSGGDVVVGDIVVAHDDVCELILLLLLSGISQVCFTLIAVRGRTTQDRLSYSGRRDRKYTLAQFSNIYIFYNQPTDHPTINY